MTLLDIPALTPGRPPSTVLTRRYWNEAEAEASRLGHIIGDPEWDTGTSLVGECVLCEELLAADSGEAPFIYGSALSSPCMEELS